MIWDLFNISIYTYKFSSKHCVSCICLLCLSSFFIHLNIFSIVFHDSLLNSFVLWEYVVCFPCICKISKTLSVTELYDYSMVVREHTLYDFNPLNVIISFLLFNLASSLSWKIFHVHLRRIYIMLLLC